MTTPRTHPTAPSDARLPFQWLTGFALRELHQHDPELGQCRGCGSTERHCPFALLGWEAMRQALTDPDSVPADPPN